MKYYLCIIGAFQSGGEDAIIDDCLQKNIYQYHQTTRQKGAGYFINSGDTLILVFKKKIIGYGITDEKLGDLQGYDKTWSAVKIKGEWMQAKSDVSLPYGVYWHTIKGNKQSIVKEIDSLWANDLIRQIILSNRHSRLEFPQEPVMHFHLPTIATFLQKDYLKIPPVQRGKVWNATRVEVLWDSIMRNIPIGTIDIRPVHDGWEILDGQQRTNSIAMGYQSFSESQKEQAILWLDIGRLSSCAEEEQTKIDRKFFFRVTTVAHPWGYKLSDDETKNIPLKHWEQKAAVDGLGLSWENASKQGARPYPYELWPIDAIFPVPFTVLRVFFEHNPKGTFSEFLNFCDKYKNANWYRYFKDKNVNNDMWQCFCAAIGSLNNKVVLAQNSINVADEDIGLYFKRLNKSGIEPDAEEIRYSLLKSKLPELKELDKIAENRMRPSRLANIAMRTYLIRKNTKWLIGIDHKCIRELVVGAGFKSFVKKEFAEKLDKIELWLLYEKTINPQGIPRILYSQLARRHPDIFCFLLLITDSTESIKKNLIGMITLIMWFDKNINLGDCYKILQNKQDKSFAKNIKTWLFEAIGKAQIIIPPPIEIFNGIGEAVKTKEMENVKAAWSVPAYIDGINRIWYWDSEQGRGLLLYVVREYLQNNFGDYDPVDAVWNEENRPWDYDHIFPQDWLRSGRGNSHGKFHELVSEFIHSIGNIAPISFSKNRGKKAAPPCEYQGSGDNNLLYVKHCEFFDQHHRTHLEHDPDLAFEFARITALRILAVYQDWYETLKIGDLLDFSDIIDLRRELFNKLRSENAEFRIFFPIGNGTQVELQSPTDWARNWLACGALGTITIEERRQLCFICIASDGLRYEIGIRRHPHDKEINGKNDWWFHGCEVIESANIRIDEMTEKLKKLLVEHQAQSKNYD